ncbi:Dihydroorotate dehydrogenase (fumarate) [Seiridium cupressi]
MEAETPVIEIKPPLLNSANPWATTHDDIAALFKCPSLGAITTRTALVNGFKHDAAVHQYTYFDPVTHESSEDVKDVKSTEKSSLNTLGYSPFLLKEYLSYIKAISDELPEPSTKLIIVSVTGTPDEVAECYRHVAEHSKVVQMPLAVEINLSCPNIPNAPPPAYSGDSLLLYLKALREIITTNDQPRIPFGLKTPPYTHAGQFEVLVSTLRAQGSPCPVSFLTATNTLGSCLVLFGSDCETGEPKLPGIGIGGMAGASLHPLALGNVATLRKMLDQGEDTKNVKVIGIGGVEDASGYRRMKGVGAYAVGVGTALGRKGLKVFEEINAGLKDK